MCSAIVVVCALRWNRADFTKLDANVFFYRKFTTRQVLINTSGLDIEGGTVAVDHVIKVAYQHNTVFGTFNDNGNIRYFLILIDPQAINNFKSFTFDENSVFENRLRNRGIDLKAAAWTN